MNEDEMKTRLTKGEDPLEISILKWWDIVYHAGPDRGPYNCALCYVYHKEFNCNGCPVQERTGESECDGTPYDDWSRENCRYTWNPPDQRNRHAGIRISKIIEGRR